MTEADIRAMFKAVDASDWDNVDKYFHPDLEYLRPGMDPLLGKAALSNFYRNVRTLRGEHRFDAVVVDGDKGACWGRFVGRNANGPVDVEFADCYGFKDGLLWRRKSFFYVPVV
ncbi:MAG: nuclear transport factor 2 family protein [Gemmatimonadales bacterium]